MKKIALLLVILSGFLVLHGQEYNYFYYKGNVIALPIHSNDCLVFFEDGTSLDSIRNAGFSVENIITMSDSSIVCVKVSNNRYAPQERESILRSIQGIKAIEPIIGFENDTNEVRVSNLFYVKLKRLSDTIKLREFANQYSVKVESPVPYCNLWYALSTTNNSFNSIACANIFYESNVFQDVDPGFLFDFRPNCVTDDYFSVEQWGLHTSNYGINACGAWEITTGVPKIKIALVDSGISITHQEFNHLNIVASYNAVTQTNDAACYYSHGTKSGGVIFADHNENRIAGVSPNCSLLNVCHPLEPNYIDRFASCINWAVQNHADVINCSWGDKTGLYYDLMHSSILEEAIDNAIENGRNGKGSILIFAAGNNDTIQTIVDYPAYYRPENITIGSSNSLGYRSPWSVYGPTLDFIAPGQNIFTTMPNWSYDYASGTSLAAPYVAGVAALVLSVNPCLTREEVTYILESTCTKIRPDLYTYGNNQDHPNGTWNIEVGHGLVNAYEAVLLAQQMGGYVFRSQTEIQSNTLWDTASLINDDLIIDSLATLTVTDTLYIAGGHRIIVRPGGKLIVNGGTLTNACDGEMWQGIIVEGNANIRQAALAQGSVILTNATIENARDAICTRGSDTNAVFEHTGGIVKATNTLFRNNCSSAEFLDYENHTSGGAVTNNTSFFTRCTFTINDDNLFSDNNATFEKHVSLYKVRGVKFNGCAFRNEVTATTDTARGRAIRAIMAGFSAKRVCPVDINSLDPCFCEGTATDTITRCSFTGFYEAVHVANSNGSYDITIDNCDFAQNTTGVSLAAADNARVSFCDFNLDHTVNTNIGLSMKNCTGYKVESNSFYRTHFTSLTSVGINVDSSGTAENVIRLNDFSKLKYGCYAWNRNAGNAGRIPPGLQYTCNDFDSCRYSIYVRTAAKIRVFQGSYSLGADNTFLHQVGSGSMGRSITIPSDHETVKYYHSSGHAPISISNCTPTQVDSANSCLSSLCGTQMPPVPRDGESALAQYRAMAEVLRALSDPIGNRPDDPQDAETTALQMRLSDLSAAMGDLARTAIRAILSDTVVDMTLLKEWYGTIVETMCTSSLQQEQNTSIPVEAYQLAEVYSTEGDYAAVDALLASLPQRFNPDEPSRNEYGNYLNLQRLRENVEGNWYRQTDAEIADLQRVAEYDNGRAARMAKEILCFFHHICYEDEPLFDLDGIGERAIQGDGVRSTTDADGLRLHPNPANTTLTVESDSPVRAITIYDLTGRTMLTVENCQSPATVNVVSLPRGIYLLRAVTDNGVKTARFVKN